MDSISKICVKHALEYFRSMKVETDVIKIILAQVNFSGYREGEEKGGRGPG